VSRARDRAAHGATGTGRAGHEMSLPLEPRPTPQPAAQRFQRENRILRRQDFLRVQRDGKRVQTRHFVIMLLPSSSQRIGITITKRVAGAVGRNRVKRVVREVFRLNRRLFPPQCELVVVARSGADQLDYATVRDEVRKASPALWRALNPSGTSPGEASS
jgi:ribonuclease P protein component